MKTEFQKRKIRRATYIVTNFIMLAMYLIVIKTDIVGPFTSEEQNIIGYFFVGFVGLNLLTSVFLSRCPSCKKRLSTRVNYVECPNCKERFD